MIADHCKITSLNGKNSQKLFWDEKTQRRWLLFCSTPVNLFSPDERSCYVYLFERAVASSLHLMAIFCKMVINHILKLQIM